MSYQFHINADPREIDEFVMNSDQNTLFQCSSWAEIKTNWESIFTSAAEDGRIVASALVLIRPLIPGTTLMYIPRGPVMDYHNQELVSFYLDHLKKLAKEKKAAAIRFDPAVLMRRYPYHEREKEHPAMNQDVIAYLKSLGCQHKGFTMRIEDSTQPRFNAEMDVEPDYREHLEHKTAKCIRASIRKGIEVNEGPEYVHDFATAMHYTEVRKKVALRSEEYFKNMLAVYGDHAICMTARIHFPKQIQILKARIAENEEKVSHPVSKKEKNAASQELKQDRSELEKLEKDYAREGKDSVITSGILAVYNRNLMELFYMGNNPDYLRMYSSYLLYAECLDRCVDLGIRRCSFGGIEGTLDDGLTLFKSNWIMNVEEYIGEFNIILKPWVYHLFDSVYPWMLKQAAKIRGNEK